MLDMSTPARGNSRQLLHTFFASYNHGINMANTNEYTSKYFSRPGTDIDTLLSSAPMTAFQEVPTVDLHSAFLFLR